MKSRMVPKSEKHFRQRKVELDAYYKEVQTLETKELLKKANPVLDFFRWHRICIDEAHEWFNSPVKKSDPVYYIRCMHS